MFIKSSLSFVILLILLHVSSCSNATRLFVHKDALEDDVKAMIEYVENKFYIKLEHVEINDVTEKELKKVIEEVSNAGNDTLFAYLPSVNVTLLNEIAKQYDVFVWNAVAYDETVCLSNVILGYDIYATSLLTTTRKVDKIAYVAVLYDGNSEHQKKYIKSLQIVFKALRIRNAMYFSKDDQNIIQNVCKEANETNQKYVLYNLYSIDVIEKWSVSGVCKDKITLVNLVFMDRTKVLNDANIEDSFYQAENAQIPKDFLDEINGNVSPSPSLTNKNTSQTAIILFEFLYLYYKGAEKFFGGDLSGGSDILYKIYDEDYYNIHDLTFSLNVGNRLITPIQSAKLKSDESSSEYTEFKISSFATYATVDGYPKDAICDFRISKCWSDPDVHYIVLATYQYDMYGDKYAKFEKGMINAFNGAINYLNEKNPVLGKPIIPIYIDLTVNTSQIAEEYADFSSRFNVLAVFSTAEDEDNNNILKELEKNNVNVLLIRIIPDSGNTCRKNVIAGPSIYSMWKFGVKEMSIRTSISRLIVISGMTPFSINSVDTILSITADSGLYTKIYNYTMQDAIPEQAVNACNAISSKCAADNDMPSGCVVVNLLSRHYQEIFFKVYKNNNFDPDTYPVVSFTVDEDVMGDDWTNYDKQYVISYFIDDISNNLTETFIQYVNDTSDNNIAHYTSNMAIAYMSIQLFANVIEIARDTDTATVTQMIVYAQSVEGPGGNIEWNDQGYINSKFHLGRINATSQTITIEADSVYIQSTNAFDDVKKKCDWLNGETDIYNYYRVIFLYITDDYFVDYLDDYSDYANVMVDNFNVDGGINGRLLQLVMKIFNNVEDMVDFVTENVYNENVLAFFGTNTNEQRDALDDILVEGKKLLFSVHPGEGERCYQNIILVGRYPNHYVSSAVTSAYKRSRKGVIVFANAVADAFYQTGSTSRDMNFTRLISDNMTELMLQIQENKDEEQMLTVFAVLGGKVNELLRLMKENNMTSEDYPLFSFDTIRSSIEDTEIWIGHNFYTSYITQIQTDENDILVKTFETQFGNSEVLLNEDTISIYTAFSFLKAAYEQASSDEFEEIKRQLNQLSLSLPVGTMKLSDEMVISNIYNFVHVEEDGSITRLGGSVTPLTLSPFLTYRIDGKNPTCKYSSTSTTYLTVNVVIYSTEENIFSMLHMYMINNNNLDIEIKLVKHYCDTVNSTLFEGEVAITSCEHSIQLKMLEDNDDLILFSVSNKNEDVCDNRIIELGTSPSQRIIPFIAFFDLYFKPNMMVIVGLDSEGSVEEALLNDTIISMGGYLSGFLRVNESDLNETKSKIDNFLSSYKLIAPDGGVIINHLSNEECHKYVFEIYEKLMKSEYRSVYEASKVYRIITWDKEIFASLPKEMRAGHAIYASTHSDENTAVNVWELGVNLLGKGYLVPRAETRAMITFKVLMEQYVVTQSFTKDAIYNYVKSNEISTTFGVVKMSDDDTAIPFPITLLAADENGDFYAEQVLTQGWPFESFRHQYNVINYTICSKDLDRKDQYKSFPVIIVISFNGNYGLLSKPLINGYLGAIDFINSKGGMKGNRMITPQLINGNSDMDYVNEEVLGKAVNETHTRIILGLLSSSTRKGSIEGLKENDLLLLYPWSYEGYECSENVIYMNSPFTEYVPVLSYIYRSLSNKIFILYTDNDRGSITSKIAEDEFEKRGITVVRSLRIPVSQYQMSIILSIVVNEMKNGVIVSLLEMQPALDFLTELKDSGYDSSTYQVVSFNIDLEQIYDKATFRLFDGHYFVNGIGKPLFKHMDIFELAESKYSFVKQGPLGNAVLSILALKKAIDNVNLTEETEENPIPYTFEDLLYNLHNVNLTSIMDNVTINSNNQFSLYFNLIQYHYDEETESSSTEVVFNIKKKDNINPYRTQYDNNGNMYYCEFGKNATTRGEKLKRESKNVALLYPIKGVNSEYSLTALDVMIGEIDTLNNEKVLGNLSLNYIVFDTSDTSKYDSIAKKIIEDPSIIVAIGCTNNRCRKSFSQKFGDKMDLWYPAKSEGQECAKNVYYTGLVPSSYLKQLSSFIDQHSVTDVFLIGINQESDKTLHNIIKGSYKDLYNVDNKFVSSGKGTSYTVAESIVEKYKSGCMIISTLDYETSIDFINYIDELVFEKNKFIILTINQDRDIVSSLKLSGTVNNYISGSFFDEINPQCDFIRSVKAHYGKIVTNELAHSSYLALRFWAKSQNPLYPLYNSQITGCTGTSIMFTDNHISLPFYIMKIQIDNTLKTEYSQTRVQEPLAWSWDIEETAGLICDWSDEDIGDSYPVNTFEVVVAFATSGLYRETDMYAMNIFETIFDDLNNNENGLLKTRITVQSYDYKSDDNLCIDLLTNYLERIENGKGVIFTSATGVCVKAIGSLLFEKDIPLFQISYTDGEACYDNVFYCLKEPSFLGKIVDFIVKPENPQSLDACLIMPNVGSGISYYNYFEVYFEFIGVNLLYSINPVEFGENTIKDSMKTMLAKAPNGCFIYYIGPPNIHVMLDEALEHEKVNRLKYPIISFSTGPGAAVKGVKPFYSASIYFTNLDNEANRKMKNSILSVTNYATEVMYTAYIAANIYINAVKNASSTSATEIKKYIYDIEYDSPSGGIITVDKSNYVKQYVMFGHMRENDPEYGFDLIYKSQNPYTPQPYKVLINKENYICDFKNKDIGDHYMETSIIIGIITSFSGIFNTTERAIMEGIIRAVEEINADGGLIGKKISMYVRDAKSDIELYKKYAKEYTRLEEVKFVFGGGRAEVKDAMTPYFEDGKKLFFYCGLSNSESCPKYVLTIQITVNQIVNTIWKHILPYTKNVYVIQGVTDWGMQLSKDMKVLSDALQLNCSVYNKTTLLESPELPEGFDIKNLDKNSVVVLAVAEDDNDEVFNWLCSHEVDMTKTYVVAASIDRYLMQNIPGKCLKGAYMITTFIKEMGLEESDSNTYIESAAEFVNSMKNAYGEEVIVTGAMESGYIAVKLWADVVSSYTLTFDTDSIRNALYGYTFTVPSGTIEINNSGYSNRIVFLCSIDEDKSIKVIEYASNPEIAQAWIQDYPENSGYLCDWTVGESRYRPPSLKAVFFHETTGNQEEQLKAMIVEHSLLLEINTNGINGYQIVPSYIFAGSTAEFQNQTAPLLEDEEVVAFFGCTTSMCEKNALEAAAKTQKLYLYYGFTEGKSCYPYRLAVGTTSSQRFLSAEQYIFKQGIKTLIFVSDDSDLMQIIWETDSYYVKKHYAENKQTISRVTITEDTDIQSEISKILSKKEDDESGRIALLYYLTGSLSQKFLNSYLENSINSREVLITFLNFAQSDYSLNLLSEIYGSLVVLGYEESLSTSISQSFVSDAKGYLGVNSAVSDNIESIKSAFTLWQQLYTTAVSDSGKILPPLRYIQLTSIGLEMDVPSGLVKVSESLYVSRNSYVFEINRNAKFIQLFPTRGSNAVFEPEPYPEGLPNECKFGKTQVFYKYSDGILGVSYALMGLSLLTALSSLIFVIVHSRQSIVKTFGRSHNILSAITLFILALSSVPITLYPTSENSVCITRVVFLGLAVKGLIGELLATESKLYQKRKIRGSIRKTKITIFRVLSCWLGFMIFEAILLIIWFTVDPNEYMGSYSVSNSDYFNEVTIRECQFSTAFVVIELVTDFLPVLVLVFMSYTTKNLANEHNDSLGMFISTIVILVLGAIMVLLDFNVSSEPDSALLLRSMGIHLTVIILCILQFGLKLVSFYVSDDARNITSSGSAGGAVSIGASSTTHGSSHKSLSSMSFTTNKTRTFTTQTKTQMSKFATLTKQLN